MRLILSFMNLVGYFGCLALFLRTEFQFVKAEPQLVKQLGTHLSVASALGAMPLFWALLALLVASWVIGYTIHHRAKQRSHETLQQWYRRPLR